MTTRLTTRLDAINLMLSIIGESPINSAEDTGLVDATLAGQLLDETNVETQTIGWDWNSDTNYKLVPNTDGEILVPSNAIAVDPCDPLMKVVERGGKLWDKSHHTFKFGVSVRVNIIRLFPFDEIPQAARYYITVRAGRKFQDRVVGSETLSGFNNADENRAWVNLLNAEADSADYNMIRDNWDVGQVVLRHTNRLTPGV